MVTRRVVAAVLAAGASSRFGTPKQLAKIGSKTLIDIALDALNVAGLDQICVVLGCNVATIKNHLDERQKSANPDFCIVQNIDWKDGLSSSIHAATKFAIAENATHLLLLACDQPFVNGALIENLLKFTDENTSENKIDVINVTSIVACAYENSAGIPAIFPAIYFDELIALEGDRGAKSVIFKSMSPILVDFPNGAQDIDHPIDLENLEFNVRGERTRPDS